MQRPVCTAKEFGGKSTVATSWLTFVLVSPNTHPYWSTLTHSGPYWAGQHCPTIPHYVPTLWLVSLTGQQWPTLSLYPTIPHDTHDVPTFWCPSLVNSANTVPPHTSLVNTVPPTQRWSALCTVIATLQLVILIGTVQVEIVNFAELQSVVVCPLVSFCFVSAAAVSCFWSVRREL